MSEKMNQEAQLSYETKYIPDFDIYEKNEVKSEGPNFASFITKGSMGAVFGLQNIAEFFGKTSAFYNPLRKVSNIITTGSTVAKIPTISAITGNLNEKKSEEVEKAKAEMVVNLIPNSVRLKVSEHFTRNTGEVDEYMKNLLGRALSKVERGVFVNGLKEGGKQLQSGLLDKKDDNKNTTKFKLDAAASKIKEAIYKLGVDYRAGACFMISSDVQKQLALVYDKDNKPIFEGNKLFGYDVHSLDELNNVIVFGNFALGYAICDLENTELKKHELYDDPGMVGFSLPSYSGAAVVEDEAFQFIELNNAAAS